jgi:hypothetical protein
MLGARRCKKANGNDNVSMAANPIPDLELLAFLDELLPGPRAVEIETQLRTSAALQQRAAQLLRRRDQGGHTLGEIWRRQRLTCPTRGELSDYLMGVAESGFASYIEFHIHEIGCAPCEANLADLRKADAAPSDRKQREKKFYDSSAGRLGTK